MASYRLAPLARTDLRDSLRYVAEHSSVENARQIRSRFPRLAEQPFMGRVRPEFGRDLRSFPVEGFVIIYRPTDYGVEIVRVVHGSRDIEALFEQ